MWIEPNSIYGWQPQTYSYNVDAVPPVHVVWNHVDTDKLTAANGGMFTSNSASLGNQSR